MANKFSEGAFEVTKRVIETDKGPVRIFENDDEKYVNVEDLHRITGMLFRVKEEDIPSSKGSQNPVEG